MLYEVITDLHPFMLPAKGKYGLRDYEKVFCPDFKSGSDIFDLRGIDRDSGCVVVVRPDQHVANILPLDGTAALDRPSARESGFQSENNRNNFV